MSFYNVIKRDDFLGQRLPLDELNQRIKRHNPNMEVVKYLPTKGKYTYCLCRCNGCGNNLERRTDAIHKKCPYCTGQKVIVGKTDIATTAPWMVRFLLDKDDAYKYMQNSGTKIKWKCPYCGNIKTTTPNQITRQNFSCTNCSDGLSRPNKFIRYLLPRLGLDELIFEFSSEWTMGKVYDAYFKYHGKEYVLEMDGEQHFKDGGWGSCEAQKKNDTYKTNIAEQQGINVIRIKCPTFDYQAIINSFENSILRKAIEQSDINWNDCIAFSEKSLVYNVCQYYNQHETMTLKDIGLHYGLHPHTISIYLNIGNKLSWCNATSEKKSLAQHKKASEARHNNRRNFKVEDKSHNLVGYFDSYSECIEKMGTIFPSLSPFCISGIRKSCTTYNMKYKGFYFSYTNSPNIIDQYKQSQEFYDVCKCFKEHDNYLFAYEIKEILQIKTESKKIKSYLIVGTQLGLCQYDKKRLDKKKGK